MYKENEEGYVYILTNPSFREHIIKIGMTTRDTGIRADELFKHNTAVPQPFEVFATYKTKTPKQVERIVHSTLDNLTDARVSENREFFDIDPNNVVLLLRDIADLLHEDPPEILQDQSATQSSQMDTPCSRKRSENIRFSRLGIPIGAKLEFHLSDDNRRELHEGEDEFEPFNPELSITVVSDDRIEYNKKWYSLSGFTAAFSAQKRTMYDVFYYDGHSLKDIKQSLNNIIETEN